MYRHNAKERGFTLIELLVVIAIIGLLSSVVLASLNSARKKARDSRRIADLKQLQLALEFYYSSNNAYPTNVTVNTTKAQFDTALAGLVSGGYIAVVPSDPTNSGTSIYYYKTSAAGAAYCLGTNMETTPLPLSSCNVTALGLGTAPTGNYVVGP